MSGPELWLRAASALALIALVLGSLKYLLRAVRIGTWHRGAGRTLDLVETLALPGSASLYIVRIADRFVALGGAAGNLCVICEVPAERVRTGQKGTMNG